ncbi:MAG: MFS transporter [Actinomycetota bacterium]|nr:MFS transporter [Actinomycetota bacterium]
MADGTRLGTGSGRSSTRSSVEEQNDAPASRSGWWTLGLTSIATFMLVLDITVVNVALPAMERSLHAQLTDLEWVVDAYAVALGTLLLISGSLADRLGRKKVFLSGMVVFTLSSAWASQATSPSILIVARTAQGVGAAGLFATALALIGFEYRGAERARALGVWGASIGAGLAVGPLVGGLLTDSFGWPSIFMVNVPLGVAVVIAAAARMPESSSPQRKRLDWPGFVVLGLAMFGGVFGLVEGDRLGWSSVPVLAGLIGSVLLGAAFVRIERRPDPMFDLSLLQNRVFLIATLAVAGQGVVIGSSLLYLLRDIQDVGGASPLLAGLEVLPMTVASFVAALLAGRMKPAWRYSSRLAVSLALMTVGSVAMLLYTPTGSWWWLLPGLILTGAGWGATNPLAAEAAIVTAGAHSTGMASGVNNTSRQVGIAAGVGGLGAVFQVRTASATAARLTQVPPARRSRLASSVARSGLHGTVADLPRRLSGMVRMAASHGMTAGLHAVELAAGTAALFTVVVLLLVGRGERTVPEPPTDGGVASGT